MAKHLEMRHKCTAHWCSDGLVECQNQRPGVTQQIHLGGSRPLPGSLVDKALSYTLVYFSLQRDFKRHSTQLRKLLQKTSNEHIIKLHRSSQMAAKLFK